MGEPAIEFATAAHVKEWWEGDGRGEHLVDLALPHEDHEDTDHETVPAWAAGIATLTCVGTCLGAIASVVVATALELF
jgi:hypothetical protein